MKNKDITALFTLVSGVLKNRDDHDIKDPDQREVVVDDLCRLLMREFVIKLRPGMDGSFEDS